MKHLPSRVSQPRYETIQCRFRGASRFPGMVLESTGVVISSNGISLGGFLVVLLGRLAEIKA